LEGGYQCFEGILYFHLQGVRRRTYCRVNSIVLSPIRKPTLPNKVIFLDYAKTDARTSSETPEIIFQSTHW
jgi:hypothetical protein